MTLTATERDLVDAASRWFDAHRAQFVDELCELLRYPSVSDESDPNPRPGAPYGPEVRRVFDHMLAKAGRDGLPTRDYTGHVMEVVYPQENVETDRDIAFVDHLDVVRRRRLDARCLRSAGYWRYCYRSRLIGQ